MTNNKIINLVAALGVVLILTSGCVIYDGQQKTKNNNIPINQGATQDNNNGVVVANTLNLSNQGLVELNMSVFERKDLEKLDISNNKLTGALPSQIGNLKNLKILKASNNDFTGVPAELGQLTKLEIIDFSNNRLTGLPNELGQLKNLKILDLSNNQYSVSDLEIIRQKLPNTKFIVD